MTTNKIIYVGVDVDDKAFHCAGLSLLTGEFKEFVCKPDFGMLRRKLLQHFPGAEIKLCYEACHIGYPLYRQLTNDGIYCDVIAPSLIPSQPGRRVKTDRLDALKLAEYYAKGLLTPINIPTEDDEDIRDLIRSRGFLVKQRKMLKSHILAACKRYDIYYQKETSYVTNWTDTHLAWLKKRIKHLDRDVCRLNIETLISEFTSLTEKIETLENVISRVAQEQKYEKLHGALISFRGISTLTAMTLISELGDIKRFNHPRKLMAYCGLDIAEYSSGGRQNKKGITKTGNRHVRTILIEASQLSLNPAIISKRMRKDREGQPQPVIDIADRCMHRLHKKSTRMLYAGKHRNKIKTAAAREMLGFIWEAMRLVA